MPNNYYGNLQKAYDFLVTSQNADGGWGYKQGGMSFTEPTVFALLALFGPTGAAGQDVPQNRFQAVQKGLTWLRALQNADGGWSVTKGDIFSGWTTYPTVWLLNVLYRIPETATYYGKADDQNAIDKGKAWILTKGLEPSVDDQGKQDAFKLLNINTDYRGWGWGINEAGWVITTSFAMLGIASEDPGTFHNSNEILNGKNYLRDRACPDGGWNVGNPYMLGKKLPATPDATSFALVAWKECLGPEDFGANTDTVNNALTYLTDIFENTNSDHTKVLSTWALGLYKEASEIERMQYLMINGGEEVTLTYQNQQLKKKVVVGQDATTGAWLSSPYTTAIAALALSDSPYYL